ncbi:MAG: hypothetical protein HY509_05840, partial [Acidobacteria bacterium]|nr:hypothetical protein [Acidobacteriota bacterium]
IFLVKKNEEYRALMHEIASAKEDVRRTEDRILEQMEIIEEKQVKVHDQDRAHQHARVSCDQQVRELLQEKERLEAETKRLEEEKRGIEASLAGDLLATFEKVARVREGIAVAAVLDESCELCHVRIRPQSYQDLKLGTNLVRCDSCSRFLYLREAGGKAAGSGESVGGG